MTDVTLRRSGDDPDPQHRTTNEAAAADQHAQSIRFDARDSLRGAFDDTTVRQAVLGASVDDDARSDTAGPKPVATH